MKKAELCAQTHGGAVSITSPSTPQAQTSSRLVSETLEQVSVFL